MGGSQLPDTNSVENGLMLNADCHAYAESHRSWAYHYGFLVPQSGVPAELPVWLYGVPMDGREGAPLEGELVLLTDDAGYRPVEDVTL